MAPNLSDWLELRAVNGFKVNDATEGRDLMEDEILQETGVMDGACARVALQIHNVNWLAASLEVMYVNVNVNQNNQQQNVH